MLRLGTASYYGFAVLLVGLWVLYVVSPIDLLPDMIPGIGRLDDLLALVGLYGYLRSLRRPRAARTAQGHSRTAPHGTATKDEEAPSAADSVAPDTPWQVLHIAPGASQEQIHAAYIQQQRKYHPDLWRI